MLDSIVYATAQLHAADSTPRPHAAHDDGKFSITLTGPVDAHALYLIGTPDELSDFVDRLGHAVIDCQRRASGLTPLEASAS